MINQITDSPVFQNYVSPRICSDLKYAGFTACAVFQWKVYEQDLILDTKIFDVDDYYKEGNDLIDKVQPLLEVLPAWTIKEIERLLPDFCICRVNKNYEMSIDGHYGVEAIQSDRLPDLFGLMMLACLRKRVIKLNKIKAA
jgi:hypothetical protein